MKSLAVALVLTLGLAGAAIALPAYAQSPGDSSRDAANRGQGMSGITTGGGSGLILPKISDPRSGPSGSNLPDYMTRDAKPREPGTAPNAVGDVPPAHWRGDTQSWERHRAACAAQFKTYNDNTDEYVDDAGAKVRCRI